MNLFICYTVLQMYIAEAIIKKENLGYDDCEVIFFVKNKTPRSNYYFERISKKCKYAIQIDNYDLVLVDKKPAYYAKGNVTKLSSERYNKVFLSSFDRRDVCYMFQMITFNTLITFDDGSANINPNSIYFHPKAPNKLKRFIKKMLNQQEIFAIDIFNMSQMHYTIFNLTIKNCFNNLIKLELFDLDELSSPLLFKNEIKKVFIGTVYSELTSVSNDLSQLQLLLNDFLIKNNISDYIPHPRDEGFSFLDINVINTEKIVEEIIIDLVKDCYLVEVYGIASTALINLSGLKNVKVFTITSSYFSQSVNEFSDFFSGIDKISL